ncbi:unnamed protein product [Ilex paraguariensis]|uniref:Uncharacterized protein n=1 Tax=Ilex paraguariensis TaxID=185542 RepID=A0ABC8SCB4_9AQUA
MWRWITRWWWWCTGQDRLVFIFFFHTQQKMAYRRRQGITKASTFKEEIYRPLDDDTINRSYSRSSSLAAQAIRASAAHRDSSLSSAYGDSAFHSTFKDQSKGSPTYDYTSMKSENETGGFWGVLARKAKAILEEDNLSEEFEMPSRMKPQMPHTSTSGQLYQPYQTPGGSRKLDNPTLRKGLDALTSSLNNIGDTIGNALEEGRTIVGNKTADIFQETRKLQIRRKGTNSEEQSQVAMATAAKAKLLLRELKTVKADLAFTKQRCSQLEEENKILREACEKGDNPAEDDMIRLQLETLLAEKARLAHENSVYARENRFLREIVEYHQLTMQDVVYLDEGIEEVTEVYPIPAVSRMLSASPTSPQSGSPPSPHSPCSPPDIAPSRSPSMTKEILHEAIPPHAITDVPQNEAPPSSNSPVSTTEDSTRHLVTYA